MPLPHPEDDALESFVLSHLDADSAALIEEHIVGCPICAERLGEIRQYVKAMQEALRRLSDSGRL